MAIKAEDFGPNGWMVDEIYHQYLADRNAVDPAWWDFFADYKPGERAVPPPSSAGHLRHQLRRPSPRLHHLRQARNPPAQSPATPAALKGRRSGDCR